MNAALFESDAPYYGSATFPEPRPFQNSAHDALREGARDGHRCQLLMSPTGSGKCLGRDTPVLMADGAVKMVQDVVPGDKLLGPHGGVRNVISKTTGREPLYRITPKKGAPYVVNASHILSLRKTPGSDGLRLADGAVVPADADVVNVNVEVLMQSNATARHCLKGWRSGAVEFHAEPADLMLDPYWLGCWLGDGHQNMPALSSPPCAMVDEWVTSARRFGYEVVVIQSRAGDCPSWRIVSRDRAHDGSPHNLYTSMLDAYGLRDLKHVPPEYKFASVENRLRLIAGMIDSDGSLSEKGFDWISKYQGLAEDFAFLCRSVGLAAYIQSCKKGIMSRGFVGNYWRVSVSGDTDRVPCLDKRAAPRTQKKRHLVHGIRIDAIGEGDYFGFEIDGDRLFLLGDFTVTHNTYLGLRLAHEALVRGRTALFIADRRTLIDQTSRTADGYGLSAHGVLMADHPRHDPDMPFQIASAQTLARRRFPDVDLIIIDEAHTQMAVWANHIPTCRARVVGLSATPFSTGLGKLFSNLVNATTMHDLTQSGVLVPMRVFSCTTADMTGAATKGGEWTDQAAQERGMEIVGDVVSEWAKFAEGRKTIVFGASIVHCEELCRQFNEAGIMASLFTSETTDVERKGLLAEYRKPDSKLRVLISVEALAKGFDVPDVGCVVDCRPLRKSLSTAIQMWGRGLRSSPETEKQDCILLDHSGNIIRFAKDFEDIYFGGLQSLDMGEKLDKAIRPDEPASEKKACPSCGFKPMLKRCMSCGFEVKSTSLVEHLPGHMREVMIGKTKVADDARHLYGQICTYTRGHGNPETAKGRAAHLYKDIMNEWPNAYSFERTPNTQVAPATLNKIKSIYIAKAKAFQKQRDGVAA